MYALSKICLHVNDLVLIYTSPCIIKSSCIIKNIKLKLNHKQYVKTYLQNNIEFNFFNTVKPALVTTSIKLQQTCFSDHRY